MIRSAAAYVRQARKAVFSRTEGRKMKLFGAAFVTAGIFLYFQGTALAANWLIVHRDGVQTVYVDKESVRHTPESVNAWVKGTVTAAVSKDKSVAGYESYYHFDCKAQRYRVTETTVRYSDGSKETTRMDNAAWKNTVDRVFFLYEYLCNQTK